MSGMAASEKRRSARRVARQHSEGCRGRLTSERQSNTDRTDQTDQEDQNESFRADASCNNLGGCFRWSLCRLALDTRMLRKIAPPYQTLMSVLRACLLSL